MTYTCAECGDAFTSDTTDEEIEREVAKVWGEIPEEERATVCEVCFQAILARMNERMINAS